MTIRSRAVLAAAVAGMLTVAEERHFDGTNEAPRPEPDPEPPESTGLPPPAAPKGIKASYERDILGRGKREGERLERQAAKGMLDDSASQKCIERIKARMAKKASAT